MTLTVEFLARKIEVFEISSFYFRSSVILPKTILGEIASLKLDENVVKCS